MFIIYFFYQKMIYYLCEKNQFNTRNVSVQTTLNEPQIAKSFFFSLTLDKFFHIIKFKLLHYYFSFFFLLSIIYIKYKKDTPSCVSIREAIVFKSNTWVGTFVSLLFIFFCLKIDKLVSCLGTFIFLGVEIMAWTCCTSYFATLIILPIMSVFK